MEDTGIGDVRQNIVKAGYELGLARDRVTAVKDIVEETRRRVADLGYPEMVCGAETLVARVDAAITSIGTAADRIRELSTRAAAIPGAPGASGRALVPVLTAAIDAITVAHAEVTWSQAEVEKVLPGDEPSPLIGFLDTARTNLATAILALTIAATATRASIASAN